MIDKDQMTMSKDMACTLSPQPRLRPAVFWLFLAAILILSLVLQPSRDVAAFFGMSSHATEIQLSVERIGDGGCESLAGGSAASHCCSAVGCVSAIIAPRAALSVPLAEQAEHRESGTDAPARSPSPLFHPPKHFI